MGKNQQELSELWDTAQELARRWRYECRWYNQRGPLFYCYENGQFNQPDWTVSQMQDFVKDKMKEMGFPGFLAGLFTKGIPMRRPNEIRKRVRRRLKRPGVR